MVSLPAFNQCPRWGLLVAGLGTAFLLGCTKRESEATLASAKSSAPETKGLSLRDLCKPSGAASAPLKRIDIDYSITGNFFAASTKDHDYAGTGNWPRRITSLLPCPEGAARPAEIQLQVFPSEPQAFRGGCEGIRVVLVNASGKRAHFSGQDGRLQIVQEAQINGRWEAIEYLEESSCGNSYHTLTLEDGEYWEFTAPKYSGSIPVIMRFHLLEDRRFIMTDIFSNAFEGRVNPGQTERHRRH